MDSFKTLCEFIILEQLGKTVVNFDLHFDVGHFSSIHRICFVDGENLKLNLSHLSERDKTLWYDGMLAKPSMPVAVGVDVVGVDSDSEDEPPTKKPKKIASARESKTSRVDALANMLKEKYRNKFNKIS